MPCKVKPGQSPSSYVDGVAFAAPDFRPDNFRSWRSTPISCSAPVIEDGSIEKQQARLERRLLEY